LKLPQITALAIGYLTGIDMGGQACIRGMGIPVSLIVNLIANEMTPDEIIKEYPDLEYEDIKESLQCVSINASI